MKFNLISPIFQKGSPYLDDINYLIGLQDQMGDSIGSKSNRLWPNTTKCTTWNKVQKSQLEQDPNVVITFEDISGLLLVLAVGLMGAMVFISVELVVKAFKKNDDEY